MVPQFPCHTSPLEADYLDYKVAHFFQRSNSVFTLKHGFVIQYDLLSGIDSFIRLCVRIVTSRPFVIHVLF